MISTPNLKLKIIEDSDALKPAVKDAPNENMMDLDMMAYAGRVSLGRLVDMVNQIQDSLVSVSEDYFNQLGEPVDYHVTYSVGSLPQRLASKVVGLPESIGGTATHGYFLLIPENVPSIPSTALKFIGYRGNATGLLDVYPGLGKRIFRETDLTLKCRWARKVLRCDPNGGSGLVEGGWMDSAPFGVFELTPPDGMVFDSWNTQPDGSGDTLIDGMPIKGNFEKPITLYAQWREANTSPLEARVRFFENAGDDESVTVTGMPVLTGAGGSFGVDYSAYFHAGHNVRIDEEPVISDGRLFLGWAESATGRPRVRPGGVLTLAEADEDVYLYARWEKSGTVDLAFKTSVTGKNASKVKNMPEAVTVDAGYIVGDSIRPSSEPTYSPYTFLGWGPSGGGPIYLPGEDVYFDQETTSLYAKWGSEYAFDANGGAGEMRNLVQFYVPECGFEPPAGKRFASWNTAADGSGTQRMPGDRAPNQSGVTTLYAIWEDVPDGE